MMVQRPCTALYLTIQGYGTFGYCLVPPCTDLTALYCLVPPCIQKRTRRYDSVPEWTSGHVPVCIRIFQQDLCVGNMCSTCWYVLVHTSTYQYVPLPVPTKSYFSMPGHTGMSWYVLVHGTHMYIPVCTGLYLSIPVHTSTSRYMYIPVHTCMY